MSDKHEHLDEGTIHAWLDGALSPDESTRIESLAATCDECGARVAEARGLIAASSRILASLDAVPGGVVPGTTAGGDQLAALRARRQAGTRRWWRDRRIVAAASLVFVAGVSSLVWRASDDRIRVTQGVPMDQVRHVPTEPVVTTAAPPATVPAQPSPENVRGEAKSTAPLARENQPRRLATTGSDSAAVQKVADASASLPKTAPAVANEARRDSAVGGVVGASRARADSLPVAQRVQTANVERQLRQEGALTRQARAQFQAADSARRAAAAPPAALRERVRLSDVVTTGLGAGPVAGRAAGACYSVRAVSAGTEAGIVDTVQLLEQQVPVLSDPAWFRALARGALRDSTLAWRSVDSTMVELRGENGAAATALRFTTSGTLPDVGTLPGLRAVVAVRVRCD